MRYAAAASRAFGVALVVALGIAAPPSHPALACDRVDQSCDSGATWAHNIRCPQFFCLAQSFTPHASYICAVELDLSIECRDQVKVSIQTSLEPNTGVVTSAERVVAVGEDWVYFDLPDASLTPGNVYYIHAEGDGCSLWAGGDGCGYAGGEAYLNGAPSGLGGDWLFRTYTMSPVPAETQSWGQVKSVYR